ncbi:MAG: hypothetical protein NZM25_01935 [Leptospiraceae bacterium]|nr:hypothetical protein [Leptospiraceae bacterium]MDW8306936.1 hypothetical protein [Leptospiraceae bacterium]
MRLALFFLVKMIFFLSCQSGPIRESEKIREAGVKAREGRENAKKALLKNLDPAYKLPDAQLSQTLEELKPFSAQPEVQNSAKAYLYHENPDVRVRALELWLSSGNTEPKLADILITNGQKYRELTPYEYKLCAEGDDERLLELLGNHLGRKPENDPIILESIGQILKKNLTKSREAESPPQNTPTPQDKGQEKGTKQELDPIKEFLPSLEKGGEEKDLAKRAEMLLLNYAATAPNNELRDEALSSYEKAHAPGGYSHLLQLLENYQESLALRLAILNYLAPREKNREKPQLKEVLLKIRKKAKAEPPFLSRLEEILREFYPEEALAEKPKREKPKVSFNKRLAYRGKLTLSEIRKLKKLNERQKLAFILKKYFGDPNLLLKMEEHSRALLQGFKDPAARILFAAFSEINPGLNFFELRNKAKENFLSSRFFAHVMRRIITESYPPSWQILATRNVWGVDDTTAQILVQLYLAEKKLL